MAFHLETQRLILRRPTDQDAEAFSRYRSDPEVSRYQGWETPYSLDRAQRFIASLRADPPDAPGQWYQVAIERKDGGEMIGDCAFRRLPDDSRQAEIGYTLAAPFQGQGYGTEAVARLIDYLFADLHLYRVRANIDPENRASARLLKKVGMRFEGRWVESLWFKGYWASEDWYAILRREWEEK